MIKPKISSQRKHKFEEERAKRVLMYCFPDRYQNAELSESPDIVVPDLSIGVEVTGSLRQFLQENFSLADNIAKKASTELSKCEKEAITEQRIFVSTLPNGQHFAGFTSWGDQHDLGTAYLKKLCKLNKHHFKRFEENNLFIFAWMIDEDELTRGISEIIHSLDLPPEYKHSFDNIYICSETLLVHIRAKDRSVHHFYIPSEIMTSISEESFLKIIGMTRDEYYSH